MTKLYEVESQNNKLNEFNIDIKDCIALCNIDDLDIFTENLKEFSKGAFGDVNLRSLYNYVIHDDAFVSKNIKLFYNENINILETIHKYSYISNFLLIYFDRKTGKFTQEITQMYDYLQKNKDKKVEILSVLSKLQELGFNNICFAENKVFNDTYEYDVELHYYYSLDGKIEIIPSMDGIKYKSNGSNYEIKGSTIPMHSKKITLNNLIFNPDNLPNELTFDELMENILNLKKENKKSDKVLQDAVYLDYNLTKIIPCLEKIDDLINNIQYSNCKSFIAKLSIDSAKQSIAEIQTFLQNYEQDTLKENLITDEMLEEEKQKYKRRYNS